MATTITICLEKTETRVRLETDSLPDCAVGMETLGALLPGLRLVRALRARPTLDPLANRVKGTAKTGHSTLRG
jgi:hypothetical protein